jgi:peptidoglycan-N-acetylglucosamine deacetylase
VVKLSRCCTVAACDAGFGMYGRVKSPTTTMQWKPSTAIKASAVLHLGAVSGLVGGMAWPWAIGGLLANHAALTIAGLWPRSTLLGSNMRSLPQSACAGGEIAITIDDGPNPRVTPAVLDILDAHQAKASFFCIGTAVEAHPQLAREMVRRGHRIENHSHRHRHHFSVMGMNQLQREISLAQEAISQATGCLPTYFRAPAGLRSPLLDPVLQKLSLQLVSWTRRGFDTVTQDPKKIQERLERKLAAGDILLLHDGNAARSFSGTPVVLEVLPKLLATLHGKGYRAVALPHRHRNSPL